MARLNAAWANFTARGQAWTHFWQDAVVTGVASPQTLTATANIVTVTPPAATVTTAVSLAAGENTVSVTAPVATTAVVATLAAGSNVLTFTAPAAGVLAAVTLAASENVITMEAPTASLSAGSAATVRRFYRGRPRFAQAVMLSKNFYYVDEAA